MRRRTLAFRLDVRKAFPDPVPPCSATLAEALLSTNCAQAQQSQVLRDIESRKVPTHVCTMTSSTKAERKC